MSENIIIERTYQTSPQTLWALWTTKAGFESWWAPEGFRAVVQTLEAHENGKLEYDMIAETPELKEFLTGMGLPLFHLEHCRFLAFRPFEHLEFRILMDFVPNVEPYENILEVDFIPDGDSVRMIVTQHPMHSEEFRQICVETLGRQFTQLGNQLP